MSITQILKGSAKLWKDKTSFSGWPITSRRPHHPALSCSVLQYLTWPRTSCISLDQLDHGRCNLGAMRHSLSLALPCNWWGSVLSFQAQQSVPDPGWKPDVSPSDPSDPDHWQRARAERQLEDAEVHPINALKCNQPELVKSLQWQDLDSDRIIRIFLHFVIKLCIPSIQYLYITRLFFSFFRYYKQGVGKLL